MQKERDIDLPGSSDRKLRLGVWGLGRGVHIIKTVASLNIEVVAGCDFNPHFLKLYQQAVPKGRFTADAEEFLSWDFDAVLLATYCPNHALDAIRCLRAGKHVLSEVTAFHTPAEGVALVEEVERSGLVYQLAENYPYTPENRYLAELWRQGIFGELQYAEYSYIHDCLNLAYTYIDGTPIEPGNSVHEWRSWLPWHYYCTHSLGPVLAITGVRPVEVVALPADRKLAGHLMTPPHGLAGMAPSLIRMSNGSVVRNLMGGSTHDRDFKMLYGTRGSSELVDGQLRLRLGGRGHSPVQRVRPPEDELSKWAASSGHGGGDFWVLHHFSTTILTGKKSGLDVYQAADLTLSGIQAFRSVVFGGQPQEVPDFCDKNVRERYRDDHFAPSRYDTQGGVFPQGLDRQLTGKFTRLMKELLEQMDEAQAFFDWEKVRSAVEFPSEVVELGRKVLAKRPAIQANFRAARELIDASPVSDGARVLEEVMNRVRGHSEFFQDERGEEKLRQRIDHLAESILEWAAPGVLPQLRMKLKNFQGLPPGSFAQGYSLREFQPGDEVYWCLIVGASFGGDWPLEKFESEMVSRADYAPERIFFACDSGGIPVATASAYGSARAGYVHYVATDPAHAGQGLGYQLTLAVLHRFRLRGCDHAILDTDDFRSAAIKVYWKLGFRPVFAHASHRDRWRTIQARTGIPFFNEQSVND